MKFGRARSAATILDQVNEAAKEQAESAPARESRPESRQVAKRRCTKGESSMADGDWQHRLLPRSLRKDWQCGVRGESLGRTAGKKAQCWALRAHQS
jgi:hypothetical protein